jgi:hypothetical protein
MTAEVVTMPGRNTELADEGIHIIKTSKSLPEAEALIEMLAEEAGVSIEWLWSAIRARAEIEREKSDEPERQES